MGLRRIVLVLGTLWLGGGVNASGLGAEPIYSRQPGFRIPFETDPNERRIQQIHLYVSEDLGRTWRMAGTAPPEQRYFNFTAPRDGTYWFTVQTIDLQRRAYPPAVEQAQPGLKVYVDTQPPQISLRGLPSAGPSATVEYQLQDQNLDADSLRLEYRVSGSIDWIPLGVERASSGQRTWTPATNAPLEVRLRARDRADNWNEARTLITPGGSASPAFGTAAAGGQIGRNNAPLRIVGSKRISLHFEIKDVGPSDVAVVELWITRDGRAWQKAETRPNARPPFEFEVSDEGTYGFTLVARSGVGLGEAPPREGDPPQLWVEVDLTKPNVRLHGVDVGRGADTGNLAITWSATDKNLGRQPITLAYAEKTEGPWTPIASNLDNTGRHVWRMPPGVPYQFFVRVEAADVAANVGTAESPKEIIVDLSQPKVRILDVAPTGKLLP